MRGRENLLVGLGAALLALLGIIIAIPVTVVTGYLPAAVTSHRLLWIGLLAGGAVLIAALTWLSQRLATRVPGAVLWQAPQMAGWVDREELAEVVSALTAAESGPVVLTTGLVGAGGFGKTMLAARACQDQAVRRRFRGGIMWITVGRDLGGAELAVQISELVRNVGGEGLAFTNPEQAGHALARVLATRGRTLLIADDVWTTGQLAPFKFAGQASRLLITTRRPAVLVGTEARRIEVDAVTGPVARSLLTRDLPPLAGSLEMELLELTGGWPLLLSLVHYRLVDDLRRAGGTIDAAAADAVSRLRQGGPAALDLADSGSRETAVAATIDYSLDVLKVADQERFLELGIFSEDAEVPLEFVVLMWQATGGLTRTAAQELCERLDGLSLVSLTWVQDVRVMILHDVIRDFTLSRLSLADRLATHAKLVGAARQVASPRELERANSQAETGTAWWRMPEKAEFGYLWQNLTYHLKEAALEQELDRVCSDLRFIAVRLRRSGPAAVEADLARSAAPSVVRLRRAIAQNAHMLAPVDPPAALATILTSRLGSVPEMANQLHAIRSDLHAWTAWPEWPMPDQPSKALIRTLAGHASWVIAVAISPDGTWLATASRDATARIWAADGRLQAVLTGHVNQVNAVAISPDGTWLATASFDSTARIWAADGTPGATLTAYGSSVSVVAISPDGTWLATADTDGTVRIWATDGTLRATLTGHTDWVEALAISPDGTWLATASRDGTARIWAADGTPRATLTGDTDWLRAVAISPDGTWLATTSFDGTARIWAANGTPRAVVTGLEGGLNAVAISPDGTWFVAASTDGIAQTWDADGTPRATLTGHTAWLHAVAISPDGSWLATASRDGTARIWAADGALRATLTGHTDEVTTLVISPDGTWLATASEDGTASIWAADDIPEIVSADHATTVSEMVISPDGTWLATASTDGMARIWAADGTLRATLVGHESGLNAVAISPDGTWLATASQDSTAMIWAADGTPRTILTGHTGEVTAVAISPDGTWVATASTDGTARIWTADGTPQATLTHHRSPVSGVAISPDGTWVATASTDGTARIWTADGTPQATLTGEWYGLNALVAISPDSSWLATASQDSMAMIWAADGARRATLTGHTGEATAVAISPDGTWLATASTDGTARIWAANGTPRATLTGHTGEVTAVAISPDGTWLATTSNDRTARIWASTAVGQDVESVTAVRVEGKISRCAWLPDSTKLCVGGVRGIYMFSIIPAG